MPKRKSYYLSGRGFSTFFDLKDGLPDYYEQMPMVAMSKLKKVAQEAYQNHIGETPMSIGGGNLRNNVSIVEFQKGSLGGSVYVQWRATAQNGYHYGIVQEQGKIGPYEIHKYSTSGTGPYFMKKTHDEIEQTMTGAVKDGLDELKRKTAV